MRDRCVLCGRLLESCRSRVRLDGCLLCYPEELRL